MKRIPPVDVRDARQRLCDLLFRPGSMPSKQRREELIRAMTVWEDTVHPQGVVVNKHHCANMHRDRDLAYLIKRGKLSVHREHSRYHARFAETFLRVKR